MFPTIEPKPRIPLSLLSSTRTTVEHAGNPATQRVRGVPVTDGPLALNRVPLHATNVYENVSSAFVDWISSNSATPSTVLLEGLPEAAGLRTTKDGTERYCDVAFLNSQGVYMSIQNLTTGTSCICTISSWVYSNDGKFVTLNRFFQRIIGQDPYDVMVPGDSLQFYVGNGL